MWRASQPRCGSALYPDDGATVVIGAQIGQGIASATLDLNSPAAPVGSPVHEEFYLYHTESVEASGFCIHFKLPHYVTFQSALDAMRDAKAKKHAAVADAAAQRIEEPVA